METRNLTTELGEITVREWGSGERYVLAVHPMDVDSSGAYFEPALQPLVDAGFHVVAPDLPGFGLTPRDEADGYDVIRLSDRLWVAMEALGAERVALIGPGYGGALVSFMAADSPGKVSALVLVDGGYVDQPDAQPQDAGLSLDEWRERARDVTTRMAGTPGLADPEALAAAAYHFSSFRVSMTWPALAEEGLPVLLMLATEPEDVGLQNERDAHTYQAAVRQTVVQPARGTGHRMIPELEEAFGFFVNGWLAPHT